MTTIVDCATLAEHVYTRVPTEPAGGWTHLDGMSWMRSFAAGTYAKGAERVIAFRGTETDDTGDILSDLMMVPLTKLGAAYRTADALFQQYNPQGGSAAGVVAPLFLEGMLQIPSLRMGVRTFANSIPAFQVTEALRYFDRCNPKPRFVTGHSLGGALAQVVAQQRSVAAVAFNSPYMGDLRGMVPMTSQYIVQINAAGDPLSIATRTVGNLSHGRVITVTTLPPDFERPRAPKASPGWMALLGPAPMVATAVLKRGRYEVALIEYVGKVALYYHSMTPLRQTIERQARFGVALTPNLTNLRGDPEST